MILINGGMGFIGMNAARRLLDAGESVVLTYYNTKRESPLLADEIGKRVVPVRLDVANTHDYYDTVRRFGVTGILYLAAPPVRGGPTAPGEMNMQLNGLMNVLGASQLPGVRRTLIASSSTLYSGLPEGPYREDMLLPVGSRSATEAFKKATEVVALHYAERAGADIGLFRMRSVYGPLYYSMNNPFSRMCHAAARGVPADFGGGPGHHPAPYENDEAEVCYVKDLVEGIFLMWQAEKLPNRVYNIGPGRAFKYGEMADAARKVVPSVSIGLTPGRNPAGVPKNAFLDVSRIRQELGYDPRFGDIAAAAADYIGWLKDHPN